MGIIIMNHWKVPILNNQYFMESKELFFFLTVAHVVHRGFSSLCWIDESRRCTLEMSREKRIGHRYLMLFIHSRCKNMLESEQ